MTKIYASWKDYPMSEWRYLRGPQFRKNGEAIE